MPCVNNLKYITGFGLPETHQHPFIENEKAHLRVLAENLFEYSLGSQRGVSRRQAAPAWTNLLTPLGYMSPGEFHEKEALLVA